jgi:hypothetical protein
LIVKSLLCAPHDHDRARRFLAGVAACDIGKHEQTRHGFGGIHIGVEQRLPCEWPQFHGLLESLDPELPENVAITAIDGEERRKAVRPLPQCSRHIVVMLRHQREHLVHMSQVVKDGMLFAIHLAPHHRQPFARRDQLGTDKNASDKAVQFLEQHYLFAKGKQFLFKLLETARRVRHGYSSSTAAVHRPG